MPASVVVNVLDVGQGSGNFVEIYNGSGVLEGTVLIDLGSALESKTAGAAAVEYVVDVLNKMTPPITIGCLILTHSDIDHINLTKALLDNFDPVRNPGTKPSLQINKILFSGDRKKYKKNKTNYLNLAEKYMPNATDTAENCGANATGFNSTTQTWTNLYSHKVTATTNVTFRLLVGGTTVEGAGLDAKSEFKKEPYAYAINSKSMVVIIEYAGRRWLITGDATGVTLVKMNSILKLTGASINPIYMATLPHHGSEVTSLDVCGIKSLTLDSHDFAKKTLENFASYISADSVAGSAERKKKFYHPSSKVIEYFWKDLSVNSYYVDPLLKNGNHFYTAYFLKDRYDLKVGTSKKPKTEDWPDADDWWSIQTSDNIFTTLYFVADKKANVELPPHPGLKVDKPNFKKKSPALGLQWVFTVKANGDKVVTTIVNREALMAAYRAAGLLAPPDLGHELKTLSHVRQPSDSVARPPANAAPARPKGLKVIR